MNEDLRKYTYIQNLGNGKHLIQDDYLIAYYPNSVFTKIAEETEGIGFKLNDIKMSVISTYPEYLRKK
tara:strand:- start:753 stop:956 length:204 start_codon:yes stop_codon:yes gene_type:complete